MRRLTLILVMAFVAACSGAPGAAPTQGAAQASPIASRAADVTGSAPAPTATPATTDAAPSPSAAPASPQPIGVLVAANPPGSFTRNPIGQITCSGSIGAGDPVAVVGLTGHTYAELRDYTDPAHPRTVCRFEFGGFGLFVNARQVVTQTGWALEGGVETFVQAVVDLPEVRYHWFKIPGRRTVPADTSLLAVSRDLGSVAWVQDTQDDWVKKIVVTDGAGDHVVAEIQLYEGRCGDIGREAAFSPSGSHLFILARSGTVDSSLLIVEGGAVRFALRPPAAGWSGGDFVDMAVWSPTSTTLFYSRAAGVYKWTPADGAKLLLPGVRWLYPTISPDGRYLAYAVPRTDSARDVYLIDLARGTTPELLHGDRTIPIFLNARQLFYAVSGDPGCGGAGTPKIYDIVDRTEYASALAWVRAIWPATSAIPR